MLGMRARLSTSRVSQTSWGFATPVCVPSSSRSSLSSCGRQIQIQTGAGYTQVQQHAPTRHSTVVAMCTSSTSPATVVEAAAPASEDLLEITQENYYAYLSDAPATELVVVDFYTDWCGPCKLIYPELVKINSSMEGVTVVKLNCNKKNKELGVKLGIKVAPTFYIYRDSVKLAEMTGAKVERLLALLKEQQQPPAVENARPPLI